MGMENTRTLNQMNNWEKIYIALVFIVPLIALIIQEMKTQNHKVKKFEEELNKEKI